MLTEVDGTQGAAPMEPRGCGMESETDLRGEVAATCGRFFARDIVLATLSTVFVSVALIQVLGLMDLDARCVEPFYDRGAGRWPYQESELFAVLLHDRGRDLVFTTALLCLLGAAVGNVHERPRPHRRRLLFLGLAITLSAGLVALLKSQSPDPSPWDATIFGGTIEHRGFFQSVSLDADSLGGRRGRSSPGAHASGAFALMGLFFWWHRSHPRRAWFAFGAGWLAGQAFGLVQVVRGAHFPSHNQWSCLVAWTACLLLYGCVFRGRLEPRP